MENEIFLKQFYKRKEKVLKLYQAQSPVYNPFLESKIILNSDGFHHLQFSARRPQTRTVIKIQPPTTSP